jgi:dolichyl-diphosphooligosaccharide--protein glycosyltransferase
MYETAAWMDDYTETAAWNDCPEYVLSQWGDNRMHSYHVSGDSRSYGFARGKYGTCLGATDGREWYDRLHGRTGFIMYQPIGGPPGSITAYGSRTPNTSGLAHYRAVHVSEGGAYRVFTLVPGAAITGTAEPNATVPIATTLGVSGRRIDSGRQVRTGANGNVHCDGAVPGELRGNWGDRRGVRGGRAARNPRHNINVERELDWRAAHRVFERIPASSGAGRAVGPA